MCNPLDASVKRKYVLVAGTIYSFSDVRVNSFYKRGVPEKPLSELVMNLVTICMSSDTVVKCWFKQYFIQRAHLADKIGI